MKNPIIKLIFIVVFTLFSSCSSDDSGFLNRQPLDAPSAETFWTSPENAELWVNNLYNGLGGVEETFYEAFSDNAYGRAGAGANNIAKGSFETNDSKVENEWDYSYIRLCLQFFEDVQQVPDFPQDKLTHLSGEVRFLLAYKYYKLLTFFKDVPLVTSPLTIEESDVPSNTKEEVLNYVLEQLDLAITSLPISWPDTETGRATQGAALALKARVLLYDGQWQKAAEASKQVMELNVYKLHPNFNELFLWGFNNKTEEVILAKQYAEITRTHSIVRNYAPVSMKGYALVLPTPQLEESFQMIDGKSIEDSPLYNPQKPFDDRDPRHYTTFLKPKDELNGQKLDLTGSEYRFARTFIYFKKYIGDLKDGFWPSHVNWILFRYADILLMYAEAKNEASGPEDSIYEALDLIRARAGMPNVDRVIYNDQSSLREFIRNERRVELAGEGLRYFDIIRWKIAENVLNIDLKSMDLSEWTDGPKNTDGSPLLIQVDVEKRVFNPSRNYVWPIPQDAIDRSNNLKQNPIWQ